MPKASPKQTTLIDLGKRLKLSPRAVSQALHGGKCTVRISEKTRQRVLALAEKLNYRPNRQAQILRMGKSGMIGILAVQGYGYRLQEELFFARKQAEEHGLGPSIYLLPDPSQASADRAIDFVLDTKVDAVLIFGDILGSRLRRIQEAGVPAVAVGSPNVSLIPRYFADKEAGFARLAGHLIEQGARTITLFSMIAAPDRRKNWHAWCAMAGVKGAVAKAIAEGREVHFQAQPMRLQDNVLSREGLRIHPYHAAGYLGMKSLIDGGIVPDALMCLSDNGVHGALLACAENGIKVPEDMMITGFEDDISSSAGTLPITSARQPLEAMLGLAFEDIKAISSGRRKVAGRSTELPCELVIRQSSRRAPCE